MVKYINRHNNQFTLITLILLLIGIMINWLANERVSNYVLLVGGIIGGLPIFVKAVEALKVKVISIDLLVSIAIIGGILIEEYEEAIVVAFLFLFGNFLEQKTLKKTRNSIRSLVDLAPKMANLKLNSEEIKKINIDKLQTNDIIVIKPGGQVPADGKVVNGKANINQAAITGESRLIHVQSGDSVFSGAIVENGSIEVKVTRVGEETTLGKIIELVEEAQDTKSPTEKFIDKFAKYYTPVVLIISVITLIITKNVKLAITILVLGCPGALVIGVPVSMVAGIGNGATRGVLLQGGNIVNQMAKIQTFVFDKTNTLTNGEMIVSSVREYYQLTENERESIASMEQKSDHPLAKAVAKYFDVKTKNIDVKTVKGQGLIYKDILIGNETLIRSNGVTLSAEQMRDLKEIQRSGASTVLIVTNGEIKTIIGISDTLKSNARSSLINLRKLGARKLVILSGDNQLVVNSVALQLGIDENYAELLPEQKLAYVENFQKDSSTAFIGDGINDSPSLAKADIGIAMGNGTDVAIETSDIVLANSSLENLVYAYALSKKTINNVKQNIFIAIVTVLLLMLGLMTGTVDMVSGMFFHELSILMVIINAMRLIKYNYKN